MLEQRTADEARLDFDALTKEARAHVDANARLEAALAARQQGLLEAQRALDDGSARVEKLAAEVALLQKRLCIKLDVRHAEVQTDNSLMQQARLMEKHVETLAVHYEREIKEIKAREAQLAPAEQMVRLGEYRLAQSEKSHQDSKDAVDSLRKKARGRERCVRRGCASRDRRGACARQVYAEKDAVVKLKEAARQARAEADASAAELHQQRAALEAERRELHELRQQSGALGEAARRERAEAAAAQARLQQAEERVAAMRRELQRKQDELSAAEMRVRRHRTDRRRARARASTVDGTHEQFAELGFGVRRRSCSSARRTRTRRTSSRSSGRRSTRRRAMPCGCRTSNSPRSPWRCPSACPPARLSTPPAPCPFLADTPHSKPRPPHVRAPRRVRCTHPLTRCAHAADAQRPRPLTLTRPPTRALHAHLMRTSLALPRPVGGQRPARCVEITAQRTGPAPLVAIVQPPA